MSSSPISKEFKDNLYDQIFKVWANPEIERRKLAGVLPEDFIPWAVQVIIDPDGIEQVRFNEEVQGIFRIRPNPNKPKAGLVSIAEFQSIVEDIEEFELTDQDPPNAAHITLIRYFSGFFIAFDFHYNAARILDHILAAREYLDIARIAFDKEMFRPFIANLHIAVELSAKALLLMHPDKALLHSKKHNYTQSKYNLYAKLGDTEQKFAQLLNKLAELRNPARYPNESFEVDVEEARELLSTAENMYATLKARAPVRARRNLERNGT